MELRGKIDPDEIRNSVEDKGGHQEWVNMIICRPCNFTEISVGPFVFHRTWDIELKLSFTEKMRRPWLHLICPLSYQISV